MPKPFILGVDFDGTVVKSAYPMIGDPVPDALAYLQQFNAMGIQLILWTIRSGIQLDSAVNWLRTHEIRLHGVNTNPTQASWSQSPKAYCNAYIDDAAIGCPLVQPIDSKPYVDWRVAGPMILQQYELHMRN